MEDKLYAIVCEHGSLKRKCEICERDERIEELEAEVNRLREIIIEAAMCSETVDHYDGTAELRKEARQYRSW